MPLINQLVFYLIIIIDNIKKVAVMGIFGSIFAMIVGFSSIDYEDWAMSLLKFACIALLISGVLIIILPSTNNVIQMIVMQNTTKELLYENPEFVENLFNQLKIMLK